MKEKKADINNSLLARWLTETASSEETRQVQDWASLSDDNQHVLEETGKVMKRIDLLSAMRRVDSKVALERVKNRISLDKSRSHRLTFYWQRISAILIVSLLIYSVYVTYQSSGGFWNTASMEVSWNEVSTPVGVQSAFELPDGTMVWLNGDTRLRYPMQFEGKERLVEVEGEAYFEVKTNKKKPLVVDVGGLFVEATGTAFNVMAYAETNRFETALVEGHVNILRKTENRREQIASLEPGQLAVYNKENKQLIKVTTNLDKYVGWRKGRLVFKSDLLEDVLLKLERWYQVEFVLIDTISEKYKYTGTFTDKNLQQVLEFIEMTTPVQFKELETSFNNDSTLRKRIIQVGNR